MRRTARAALAAVVLVGGSACHSSGMQPAPAPVPTAATEWPLTFGQATTQAREGRTGAADRTLTDFAARFPGSTEAVEVPYWRAVIKLDPGNPAASHDALVLLDAYLADTSFRAHRLEATTFRRLQAALEARTAALAAQPVTPAVRPEEKAKDEEIARLRDELAKANAELARIKRRLTHPK
ncbi:MAG TPA: hypothetical protein VF461_21345 [Gemmatimonadaceae bacterium]